MEHDGEIKSDRVCIKFRVRGANLRNAQESSKELVLIWIRGTLICLPMRTLLQCREVGVEPARHGRAGIGQTPALRARRPTAAARNNFVNIEWWFFFESRECRAWMEGYRLAGDSVEAALLACLSSLIRKEG